MKHLTYLLTLFLFLLSGCENTNIQLVTEAGLEAVKAATLSNEEVRQLASQAALITDQKSQIAPAGNNYAQRLLRLVGSYQEADGIRFNYRVYLSSEVNAFAMADGTIRIYSGLMDMMDDDELRFVIGHEMGHVALKHIRKKIQLAYAASAVRKGIASQQNILGSLAASQLGGFSETLLNAQFSQHEEREADDYGLAFLQRQGHTPHSAVSALKKLATLGSDHSFLSSHPAPGIRAERLRSQLSP
ncbi:M48 family metallopeptidase [Methanococcoides sp. SA1]|uniref:M48 family metallopeptidase n=1 Tax=Candidatus Desulfatifera sulfidica TaxID=2841691 RepID=A0A8J6TD48_9BACT|nr:M48 family metallopeptidase [Candidatus Desulfatifera sulfidica]NPE29471.1 M48 family metallopeptidase [Methanococcoides sp. SA1]